MTKKRILFFGSVIGLILLDQLTKLLFTGKTFFEGFPIHIAYRENTGSAFNLFSGINIYPFIVIILSLLVLAFLCWNLKILFEERNGFWITLFAAAGVCGNLIDRLFFYYVRDFIKLDTLFVFNLADFYLFVAVLIFLLPVISESKHLKR